MRLDLQPTTPPAPATLDELWPRPGRSAAAEAEGTRRNDATDWRAFLAWRAGHGFESLPADAESSPPTSPTSPGATRPPVVRRAVGIAKGAPQGRVPLPHRGSKACLVLAGIRRTKGTAPGPRHLPGDRRRAWMARTAPASGPVFRAVDRHGRLGPGRLYVREADLFRHTSDRRLGL